MDFLQRIQKTQFGNQHGPMSVQSPGPVPMMSSSQNFTVHGNIVMNKRVFTFYSQAPETNKIPLVMRNINPHQILSEYRNGKYNNMKISGNSFSVNGGVSSNNYNRLNEKYYEINNGKSNVIVTTNQADLEESLNQNSVYNMSLKKCGICIYCRMPLEKMAEGQYPVGIPYKIENRGGVYVFHTISKYCSFECAYGYCLSKDNLAEYITNLKIYFETVHPGKKLTQALDPDLHIRNGGMLSDEQYYRSNYAYHKRNNYISVPAKKEFSVS
jgi:hypothetical protein